MTNDSPAVVPGDALGAWERQPSFHVSGKRFDTPLQRFISGGCLSGRQGHPGERCSRSSRGRQVPQPLSLLIPSRLLSPKRSAPLPCGAVVPTRGTASRFWGRSRAQRSPGQELGGAVVSPAASCASAGTCAAEGEKTVSSPWWAPKARLRHRSPGRSGEECSRRAAFRRVLFPASPCELKAISSTEAAPAQL